MSHVGCPLLHPPVPLFIIVETDSDLPRPALFSPSTACLPVRQCGALMSLLLSYLLPLKYNAPSAAVLLAVSLHSTLLQCGAQCRAEGGADVMYAGEPPPLLC